MVIRVCTRVTLLSPRSLAGGTRWSGIAASADWYKTIVEGMAGGAVPTKVCGTKETTCRQIRQG